jgi:hypothetical protein
MKEKVANQGFTQVLRDDASPSRSELHRSRFCGEAHTALRGWRPISAALSCPVPLLFVRDAKDFPNQPLGLTALLQPQKYKRISTRCQIESLKKYIGPIGDRIAMRYSSKNILRRVMSRSLLIKQDLIYRTRSLGTSHSPLPLSANPSRRPNSILPEPRTHSAHFPIAHSRVL